MYASWHTEYGTINGVYPRSLVQRFKAIQNLNRNTPSNMGTLASYKLASRLYRKLEYYSQLPHEDQEVYRPQLMASIQMFEEARRRYRKLSTSIRPQQEPPAPSSSDLLNVSHAAAPLIDVGNGNTTDLAEMPTIIRSEATALVNEVDSEWRDDWGAYTLPVTATHYPPEVIVNHRASDMVSEISSHGRWGSYSERDDRTMMSDEDDICAFFCEAVPRTLTSMTHFFCEQGHHEGSAS